MTDSPDEIIDFQAKELASMRSISAEVFATLRIDEQDFIQSLHDESKHSPAEWAFLQKHRLLLKNALENRLKAAVKKSSPKKDLLVQPHWIYVK